MQKNKYLLILTFLIYSSFSFATSTSSIWKSASHADKMAILEATKHIIFKSSEAKSEWLQKKTTFFRLIEAAYAADMNCIYAGWPSSRVSGLCSSPARQNPNYSNGSCSSDQMQCQPLLFGAGLCASMTTREERNMAFSNCQKQFQSKGRTLESVYEEIQSQKKEEELIELIDYARKICSTDSVQAQSAMCRRLEQVVGDMEKLVVVEEELTEKEVAPIVNAIEDLDEIIVEATSIPQACLPEIDLSIQIPMERVQPIGLKVKTSPEVQKVVAEPVEVEVVAEQVPVTAESVPTVAAVVAEPQEKAVIGEIMETPEQALQHLNNGELVLVGKGKFYGYGADACLYKSQTAFIVYHSCKKNEADATDIEVISFTGGKMRFYVENGTNVGPISQLNRSQYNGAWNVDYEKTTPISPSATSPAEMLKEVQRYYEKSSRSYPSSCYYGTYLGDQNNTSGYYKQSGCNSMDSDFESRWESNVKSFWDDPDKAGWTETLKNMRKKIP